VRTIGPRHNYTYRASMLVVALGKVCEILNDHEGWGSLGSNSFAENGCERSGFGALRLSLFGTGAAS
jgi:hypothetical protein